MERFTKLDPARTLAAATAHDFNNELTVILSSIATLIEALEPGHPALAQAQDVRDAAQRCARKTSGLLRFGSQCGARVLRTSLERLLDDD